MSHAPRFASATNHEGHPPRHAHAARRRARRAPGARLGLLAALTPLAAVLVWSSPSWAATATVDVANNATFGTVLTNAQGMALYTFPQDHGSTSACDTNSACMSVWPALTIPAGTTPTAGPGVTGTVGAAMQSTGVDQVTYNGAPLYTFVGDSSPGQVSGNGIGGFAVVTVAPATPSSTPTSTPTTPTTAAPPAGTATPTTAVTTPPTSPSRAPATSPASGSTTTPSTASAPTAPPASPVSAPPALAHTGPGSALVWIAVAGLALLLPGTAAMVWGGPGRRRRMGRSTASRA